MTNAILLPGEEDIAQISESAYNISCENEQVEDDGSLLLNY